MESGAMGTKGMNEFQAEIAVLTKVRHRHLVALLGYCINGNERLWYMSTCLRGLWPNIYLSGANLGTLLLLGSRG
ncbi:unnamed protein product [Camellia sinensis]